MMGAPLVVRPWQLDRLREVAVGGDNEIIDEWLAKGYLVVDESRPHE